MKRSRDVLWAAGLLFLGVLTLVLSTLAVIRPGPVSVATPAPKPSPVVDSPLPSGAPGSTPPPTSPSQTVVVVGDRLSVDTAPASWVKQVGDARGWKVINLSVPGRGYLALPARDCGLEVCGTFEQTLPLVAQTKPDVVITFGGVADGDVDIASAATSYYAALRKALPNADLIAISPVTTEKSAAYWLTMHRRSVKAGIEAARGSLIDVGQPSLGSGRDLSPSAQEIVAERINAVLDAKR